MSDVDWGSEGKEAPKAKRRLPVWLWFCGGGCLLALIIAGVAAFLGARFVKDAVDPDKQWDELAKIVPFEPRPEGHIFGMKVPFQDLRTFSIQPEGAAVQAVFMVAGGKDGEALRSQYFDVDAKVDLGALFGNVGRHELEEGTFTVQGRELRCMRFISQPRDAAAEDESQAPEEPLDQGQLSPLEAAKLALRKSSLALDLSDEASGRVVIFQYDKIGTLEGVQDAEVLEFLAPFKIGEQR